MHRTEDALYSLSEKPDCTAATLELIRRNFPNGSNVKEPAPLEKEFPLLLDPAQRERVQILIHEKVVVSSASFRPFEVQTQASQRPLKCAGIGLVVTDDSARGKGYASRIQEVIEQQAILEGCAVGVLWSDLVQFYAKRGYIIAGTEMQWHLETESLEVLRKRLKLENSPEHRSYEIRPLTSLQGCDSLYEEMKCGPKRDWKLYESFLSLPNTWAWGAWKDGELKTYAFLGKARDLRDTVHELIGDPKAIAPLLSATLPHLEKLLRVHQPWGSPMQSELEHWLGKPEKTPLAFFKVLDVTRLCTWLNSSGCMPHGVQASADETRVFLSQRNSLTQKEEVFFESDDHGHLIQLFFGPWSLEEMTDLPEILQKRMKGGHIPPLYLWGFDSV